MKILKNKKQGIEVMEARMGFKNRGWKCVENGDCIELFIAFFLFHIFIFFNYYFYNVAYPGKHGGYVRIG